MQLFMGNANPIPTTKRSPNMIKKKQTTTGQGTLKAKSGRSPRRSMSTRATSRDLPASACGASEDERFLQVAVGEKPYGAAERRQHCRSEIRGAEEAHALGRTVDRARGPDRVPRSGPRRRPAPSRRLRSPSGPAGSTASTCSPRA